MNQYEYKPRLDEGEGNKEFCFGEGKISAVLSLLLGLCSFLAVLAFLYPSYLTTIELRQVYDAYVLQKVLMYGMYFSLFFGVLASFLNRGKYRRYAFLGIALTGAAFLLGGYQIPIGDVEPVRLSLGVDWLILAFLGSVFVFTTLEVVLPKYKNQGILRPEWDIDLFYFCFNHLAISAIIIFANYHVSHFDWLVSADLQGFVSAIPVWVQVVLIILAADFVLYWEHRAYHEITAIWPVHAVHHSVEQLDWLAGSRGHVIQVFLERATVMIPLYVFGFSPDALNVYVVFAALHAVLIHCNTRLAFGPFKYVFVTPQYHHWHHASDASAIDTNYCAHTVIFDRLFGTYHMPSKHWPFEYGTTKPLPKTVWGQLLYPLKAPFSKK